MYRLLMKYPLLLDAQLERAQWVRICMLRLWNEGIVYSNDRSKLPLTALNFVGNQYRIAPYTRSGASSASRIKM
jgi:hypothetical protein